jgi:hypothetical protein
VVEVEVTSLLLYYVIRYFWIIFNQSVTFEKWVARCLDPTVVCATGCMKLSMLIRAVCMQGKLGVFMGHTDFMENFSEWKNGG